MFVAQRDECYTIVSELHLQKYSKFHSVPTQLSIVYKIQPFDIWLVLHWVSKETVNWSLAKELNHVYLIYKNL